MQSSLKNLTLLSEFAIIAILIRGLIVVRLLKWDKPVRVCPAYFIFLTKEETDMNEKIKNLFKYLSPAVGCLCVTYLYNIVDGIFVGQGVGDIALGAVNIAVPFVTFVVALAAMFPMGGATIVAIRKGRGDEDGANNAFMTSFVMTVAMSLLLMIIGMTLPRQIAFICGAKSDEMLSLSTDYIFYYTLFSIPMLLSNCMSVFVRNDGSPSLAFWGMLSGALANIFLDWLFIFPLKMGIVGAAIASGLGQIVSFLVLMCHFFFKKGNLRIKKFKFTASLSLKICKRGIPEAITQMNTPVTALCFNLVLGKYMGDIGISAFSVLSFIYSLANAILSGVAQGLQPLWGNAYGKGEEKEISFYTRAGIGINIVLAVIIYGVLLLLDVPIIKIFNSEAQLVEIASKALPFFALSFIPMSLNLVFSSLYLSTTRTWQSNTVAICRGIALKAIAVFCMPLMFGANAVWWAPFAAEILTFIVAIILYKTKAKQKSE